MLIIDNRSLVDVGTNQLTSELYISLYKTNTCIMGQLCWGVAAHYMGNVGRGGGAEEPGQTGQLYTVTERYFVLSLSLGELVSYMQWQKDILS